MNKKKIIATIAILTMLFSINYGSAEKIKKTDTRMIQLKVHVYFDDNENGEQDSGERNAIFAIVGAINPHGYNKKRLTLFFGNAYFSIPIPPDTYVIWAKKQGLECDSMIYIDEEDQNLNQCIVYNLGLK